MELIVKAIGLHQGNLTRVACDLEVSRTTLDRKLRAYNLEKLVPSGEDTCSVRISQSPRPLRRGPPHVVSASPGHVSWRRSVLLQSQPERGVGRLFRVEIRPSLGNPLQGRPSCLFDPNMSCVDD